MFLAVASHKFVIAFCIGIELIASRTRTYLSVIYTCTFAVVSPIGIGIGMALVGGGSAAASGSMAVILQASFSIFFGKIPDFVLIKNFDDTTDDDNTRVGEIFMLKEEILRNLWTGRATIARYVNEKKIILSLSFCRRDWRRELCST